MRIEKIDFKNNQEVKVDHRENKTPEKAVTIEEFGARAKVEWESPKAGEIAKNWPLAFVKAEKPKLTMRFEFNAATEAFFKTELEGNVTVTGETTVGGAALKFKTELTKAELEANRGFVETREFEAENALPNKVAYTLATITWKWKWKQIGHAAVEEELGKTIHNFYTLYNARLRRCI